MLITAAIIAAALCGWLTAVLTIAPRARRAAAAAYTRGEDAAYAELLAIANETLARRAQEAVGAGLNDAAQIIIDDAKAAMAEAHQGAD